MEKKVLIADDETHIRNLLEQTLEELEEEGVELLFAKHGAEALEMIRSEKPELVFLDFNMPKMNGIAVCEAIKKDSDLQPVYISNPASLACRKGLTPIWPSPLKNGSSWCASIN